MTTTAEPAGTNLRPAAAERGGAASQLTVVHRQDCDLCDEMVAELQSLARQIRLPEITLKDVDQDSELKRRFDWSVPVLLLDGTVVCKGRLDVPELRRLLKSAV